MSLINNVQTALRNTGSQYPGLPLDGLTAFGGNSYFATLNALLTSTDDSKKYLYPGIRVVNIDNGRIYRIKNNGSTSVPVFKGIYDDNKRVWYGTTLPASNTDLSDALIDDIYIQYGISDVIWRKNGLNHTTTDYTSVINFTSLIGSSVEYYVSDITIATNGTTNVPVTLKRTGSLSDLTANIPGATSGAAGIVTTGAQTIAGNKTFNNYVNSLDRFRVIVGSPEESPTILFQVYKDGSVTNIVNTGTLANAGAVTFSNTLSVLSDRTTLKELTVNETVSITGAATLSSTLDVAGVANFSDNLKTHKYAAAGHKSWGNVSSAPINLSDGNTHFIAKSTAAAVTISCSNSDLTDLWNYRGGSFIISVMNSSASSINVTFSSPVFIGINSDVVALGAGEGLTYSGVVMGLDNTSCGMYGTVAPISLNLML